MACVLFRKECSKGIPLALLIIKKVSNEFFLMLSLASQLTLDSLVILNISEKEMNIKSVPIPIVVKNSKYKKINFAPYLDRAEFMTSLRPCSYWIRCLSLFISSSKTDCMAPNWKRIKCCAWAYNQGRKGKKVRRHAPGDSARFVSFFYLEAINLLRQHNFAYFWPTKYPFVSIFTTWIMLYNISAKLST